MTPAEFLDAEKKYFDYGEAISALEAMLAAARKDVAEKAIELTNTDWVTAAAIRDYARKK